MTSRCRATVFDRWNQRRSKGEKKYRGIQLVAKSRFVIVFDTKSIWLIKTVTRMYINIGFLCEFWKSKPHPKNKKKCWKKMFRNGGS